MKVLAALIVSFMLFAISTGVMIWGWGLTPQNWLVIGGGWLACLAMTIILEAIRS